MRLDSAPEVETLPISSWLKRAMQLTLPSRVGKAWEVTVLEIASTAQNLGVVWDLDWTDVLTETYDETRLSMRGLKMNSLSIPPRTAG